MSSWVLMGAQVRWEEKPEVKAGDALGPREAQEKSRRTGRVVHVEMGSDGRFYLLVLAQEGTLHSLEIRHVVVQFSDGQPYRG